MRIALMAVTDQGWRTAESIRRELPDAELVRYESGVRNAIEEAWSEYDALICVMAAGIVVRCIAGLCSSKYDDPSVIVIDETGAHVISLLSGHIGGGNALATEIAGRIGGRAVITTASDVTGHTAVDLWSVEQNCFIANPEKLASTSARLLRTGSLSLFQDGSFIKKLPADFRSCTNPANADIIVSLSGADQHDGLHLIPRLRFVGFGCRRGAGIDEFKQVLHDLENLHDLDLRSVAGIASIDLKRDEIGLLEMQRLYRWPIRFFSKEQINATNVPGRSHIVFEKIGVYSVSEAAAVLAAADGERRGRLIIEKLKWQRITAAVAETVY